MKAYRLALSTDASLRTGRHDSADTEGVVMADAALRGLSQEYRAGELEWEQPLDQHLENFYFYGQHRTATPGPQAFLVSCDPGRELRAHFHHLNQFQIFFGAPGATFKRHEIGRLMVHYTDAETLYGPINAGDNGLRFMTLRPRGANFIGFLPEDREAMLQRPTRRHHEVQLDEWLDEPLPPKGELVTTDVFAQQDDGLFAVRVAAGAGATIDGPPASGGAGQYVVVVKGAVTSDNAEFSQLSVGWLQPGDNAAHLVAGNEGARVLFLQFPYDQREE